MVHPGSDVRNEQEGCTHRRSEAATNEADVLRLDTLRACIDAGLGAQL
jgi:hypothetical protein